MTKIAVTGGAGFIGSWVVDKYIEEGHEVYILDNLSTGQKDHINPKAHFFNIDIRDATKVGNFFNEFKPDVLNHHAAQLDVRKSVEDPVYDAQVNIVGFLNLLEAGRRNGIKKIIFASSGGVVYGDAKILPTPEDYQPLMPISPYGVAKLTSEHYLYYYYKAYGLPYIALRYANVYGPRQDPHGEAGVVAIFSEKLLKNSETVINGDGKQTRDYVNVVDVARANIISLTSNFVGSLNVGTGIETSVNEIFKILKETTGSMIDAKHGSAKTGEQKRSALKIEKIKELLNWEPEVKIQDGLRVTVDYFRNK